VTPKEKREHNMEKSRQVSKARYAAFVELARRHKAEFDVIYNAEAEKRGIRPQTVRRADRIEALKEKLKQLEAESEG
jgi:hypothetical protein